MRRIGHQSPTSAAAAPSAQPRRSDVARISSALRWAFSAASVSAAPGVLGSGPTADVRRTRNRRSRSNAFGGASKPVAGKAFGGMAMGELDQARLVAMQAAQQMHAIGEVSRANSGRRLRAGHSGGDGATIRPRRRAQDVPRLR